jgi:hypothetical protein
VRRATAQVLPEGGDDVSSPLQLLKMSSEGPGGREQSPGAGTGWSWRPGQRGGFRNAWQDVAPVGDSGGPHCNSRKSASSARGAEARGGKPPPSPRRKMRLKSKQRELRAPLLEGR